MLKTLMSKLFAPQKKEAPIENNPEVEVKKQQVVIYESDPNRLMEITKSPFPGGSDQGYVYFLQESLNGTFKIGKTASIDKDMKIFKEELPFKTQLVHLIKSGESSGTEASFHNYFSPQHLENGWYDLSRNQVAWIKEENYTEQIRETIGIAEDKSEKPLTQKQIDYAKTLVKRLEKDYVMTADYSALTTKDLNRLLVYFRYKNERALLNLVKKGVLSPKQQVHS
ncbi:GIY-YIG nuclease family protein [Rossellomorea vietnamensis]|uniref:GIY-YIG nuclease family protein n=1 Tax=Rossellomorea vietnamensis TaxID=218284 RepID=A0A5D4NY92_9BACI|nr:GIY-YIG nuclease family protein [Rossellomorea vietnamensis]TYS18478.1 GIY-YIG nuclease family protein [Rossellomorea vietnamensis]